MIVYADTAELFAKLCKQTKKWGLLINWNPSDSLEDLMESCPYFQLVGPIWLSGEAYFFFDSEEEMNLYYNQTVHDGVKAPVYALTCDNAGNIIDENT